MKSAYVLLIAILCFSFVAANSFAQQNPIAGAYSETSRDDPQVMAAAKFAVEKESKRLGKTVTLISIEKAETQVVAGLNYRLRLKVQVAGQERDAQAVVYQSLKQEFSLSEWKDSAADKAANAAQSSTEREAILKGLKKELGRETSGHVKVTEFNVTDLDVRSAWALAHVEQTGGEPSDPFIVLMRKLRGGWKVLTLGTNLHGAGREYRVPRRLWQKWELN